MPFPFAIWGEDSAAPPIVVLRVDWFNRVTLDTPDGTLDDGDRISTWTDGISGVLATQATAVQRPTWRATQFPGLGGIEVQDDRHLKGAVTGDIYDAMIICKIPSGAARGLLSRDTSAVTNKPAFTLRIADDFG